MRHEHYAEAEAAFAEAKAVYEAALGPNHPRLIGLLGTMAGALAEQGRFEEAAASIEEAERRLETGAAAADHPMRASLSHNLASVLVMQGDHPRAIERYRHAIEIRRRLGMKNDLAAALTKMGQSLIALERFEEAREAFDEAERLDVEAHTDDGNRSPYPPLELGKLARRRGDLKDARDRLETAWLFSGNAAAPTVRAEVGLQLGQVLWDLGRDRARGHALVRQALEIAEASEGNAAPGLATAARGWLADHRVPGGQAP
jgi:tetratricopeptide (TPR) repeat protein